MRLVIERELPAPPAQVWPCVTEPDRMNEWSTARIEGLSPGNGGSFGAAGARRRVRIPLVGFAIVLEEVIEDAEPPSRLVYRVVSANFPFHAHRGEIELAPSATGTALRWAVDANFPVPLVGRIAGRFLTRELGKSLDRLGAVLTAQRQGRN